MDERVINCISYVKDYEHMTSRALFGDLLPFAACQSDMLLDRAYVDLFCLDYRQGRRPRPVVLWEADRALRALMKREDLPREDCFDEAGKVKSVPWDEFIKPVAPAFGAFVELLQPVGIYYCSIRESFRESLDPRWRTSTVCKLGW